MSHPYNLHVDKIELKEIEPQPKGPEGFVGAIDIPCNNFNTLIDIVKLIHNRYKESYFKVEHYPDHVHMELYIPGDDLYHSIGATIELAAQVIIYYSLIPNGIIELVSYDKGYVCWIEKPIYELVGKDS